MLEARARIIREIRAFFVDRGFLEVETPHRIPAPAPEAHIDAVAASGWWLHTSPELAMKRLLAAGHDRIFQVCRCWRDGERGRLHLSEFTLLEWYRAGADYQALMDDCEALFRALAGQEGRFEWGGRRVGVAGPWPRIPVEEAFRRYAGEDADRAVCSGEFDRILVERVEPALAGASTPVFLVDYPAPLAALSRLKPGRPDRAERFELYAAGLELANGFSELTDPAEQRARFRAEAEQRAGAGKPAYPSPEPFLAALGRMPSSAGIALGVDRLVMLLTGAASVDDVVAFAPEEL